MVKRMKKVLAEILLVCMMISSVFPAYAETAEILAGAEVVEDAPENRSLEEPEGKEETTEAVPEVEEVPAEPVEEAGADGELVRAEIIEAAEAVEAEDWDEGTGEHAESTDTEKTAAMLSSLLGTGFSGWTALTSTGGTLSGGNYYLDGDVTLNNNITVNGTVTIDLNGHVLKGNGSGSVISVNESGRLTLQDSNSENKTHKFMVDENRLWTLDEQSGTKIITGGVITGGTGSVRGSENLGGGVYVDNGGTLVMNDGTIAGCSATKGGGVYTWGDFTMNNSSAIVGCTATVDGGGVCACNCSFIMEDSSKVSECTAGNGAGGVYTFGNEINNPAYFTMNGNSTISECKAGAKHTDSMKKRSGGGVCVEGSTFTMNGGAISGNEATAGEAGGVLIYNGTFNMTGGTIVGNIAKVSAGGVKVPSGAKFNMTGGTINGNTSGLNGGGVFVTGGGNVVMTGGKINGNTSVFYGGGVYVTGNNSSLTMTDGEIINNTATSYYGGGVYVSATDTVTLGGSAKITGNKKRIGEDEVTQNVYLPSGKTITIGTGTGEGGNHVAAPKEDMNVGVTMEDVTGPFTTNGTAEEVKYFTSDDKTLAVTHVEEKSHLELVKSWTELQKALGGSTTEPVPGLFEIKDGSTIKLLADFKADTGDTTLVVSDTKTLDLNGHVINANRVTTVGSVITVEEDANLTLKDNTTTTHKFKVSTTTAGLWELDDTLEGDNIKHTITGGVITGGTGKEIGTDTGYRVCGGGVIVYGTFAMDGGNIAGNMANASGGGVYIYKPGAEFTMNGGMISGNYGGNDGGGVSINEAQNSAPDGTLTMTGGTISGNTANYGGGIQNNGGILKLIAAEKKTITISGNTATSAEGGVSNWKTMHLSGKVIIKDNICNAKDDEDVSFPLNLATCTPIIIDSALTGSDIHITHIDGNDNHDTGVLTSDFTDKNTGAKLGDFFTYDGPEDSFAMVLNADGDNEGELEVKVVNSWKTEPSIPDVTYGTAISPVGEATFGTVEVTYIGVEGTSYESSTAPTKAGKYKATFKVTGTTDYTELTKDVAFTIDQKQLTASGTTVEETRVYDGTTTANVTNAGTLGDKVGEDNVTLSAAAAFADANAGKNKAVTVTYTITGDDAGNYIAPVNNTSLTASITKANVPAPLLKDSVTINCAAETIAPKAGYELSLGSGEAFEKGKITAETAIYFTKSYYIRKAEDENHFASAELTYTPTHPAAPSGFTAKEESIENKKDGTFSGITSAMEYQKNGSEWISGPATLSGLSNETITVRVKATDEAFKSLVYVYTFTASTEKHSVTMGDAVVHVPYDGLVTRPADPEKEGFTFGGWYTEEACITAWNFAVDTVKDNMTLYPKWIKNEEKKAVIGGNVTEDGVKVSRATVELFLGTEKIAATVTDNDGNYKFDNVKLGTYNIVVTKTEGGNTKTKTELVTVDKTGEFSADVKLPKGDVNSVVEHKPGETSADAKTDISQTVVGGLDEIAEKETPSGTDKITIKLKVEPKKDEETAKQKDIKKEAGEGKKVEFLDLSLVKQVNAGKEEDIGDNNDTLLTIVIPFDFTNVEIFSVMILRNHGGKVEKITTSKNDKGEYLTKDYAAGTLTIHAMKFSDYAIAYSEVTTPDPSDDESDERHITAYAEPVANATAVSGSWQYKEAEDTWYYIVDGSSLKNGWYYLANPYSKTVKTGWFCFDEAGKMQRGWILSKLGHWFFTHDIKDGDLGRLEKGWHKDDQDGLSYYLDLQTGRMYTGWHVIDGVTYYFTETSVKSTWKRDEKGRWVATAAIGKPLGSLDPTAKK